MSLEYVLLFVFIAALAMAVITGGYLSARERHEVHVRATALACAIFLGSLIPVLVMDIVLNWDVVTHATWETRGYHWLIGIVGGALIYWWIVHTDKRNRLRIINGEVLNLDMMLRYSWLLEEQRKQQEAGTLGPSDGSRIEEILGRPDEPLVRITRSDGTTTQIWDADTKSWQPYEPKE